MAKLYKAFDDLFALLFSIIILLSGALATKLLIVPKWSEVAARIKKFGKQYPDYFEMSELAVQSYIDLIEVIDLMANTIFCICFCLSFIGYNAYKRGLEKYRAN